jgi:hypothetical protein
LSEPIQLLSAVRHFQELPHQCEAWVLLQDSLTPEQLERFAARYRGGLTPGLIQLPVPYLSQNDSATSQGPRMCFSSSCAMAAAFLKPGALNGNGQLDDQYLALVQRHGDSTDANAQVKALQSLGLQARFRTDGSIQDLIKQLKRGLPCPVGWLHKGPVSAPKGGGHWSLAIGWERRSRSSERRLREHRHWQRSGSALFRAQLGAPLDGGGRRQRLVDRDQPKELTRQSGEHFQQLLPITHDLHSCHGDHYSP